MAGRTEIVSVIDEYVLNARARKVLYKRLYDDSTIEVIAEECDVSVGTVKNDLKRWLPTVQGHLHF